MQHFALGHMAISLSQLLLQPLSHLVLLTVSHVFLHPFCPVYFFSMDLTGAISLAVKHRLRALLFRLIRTDLLACDCYLRLSSISLATTERGRKKILFNFHFRFFFLA